MRSWNQILFNALGAVLTLPAFLWLALTGSSSGLISLLCLGILGTAGLLAVLFIPQEQSESPLQISLRVVGSLIFALLMLIVQPSVWLSRAGSISFSLSSLFSLPMLWPFLWALGSFGVAWFVQAGLARILALMRTGPGDRDAYGAAVFFLLFLVFCVFFFTIRIGCPSFSLIWQNTADTAWLESLGWPMLPGLLYQLARVIAILLRSSETAALGFVVGLQIVAYSASAAYAGCRLYVQAEKYWPVLVYALMVILWYPGWIYMLSLDGIIWTSCGLLLVAASLPGLLNEDHISVSSWVCLIIGSFLLCLQVTWGWILITVLLVIMLLFVVWKHWQQAIGLLVAGVLMVALFFVGLPFLGWKADYSAFFNIPLQQISRVVSLERTLSSDQTVSISVLAPIQDVKDTYYEHTADPMRALLQENASMSLLTGNPWRYFSLAASLSAAYPVDAILSYYGISGGLFDGSVPKTLLPTMDVPMDASTESQEEQTASQSQLSAELKGMEQTLTKILTGYISLVNNWLPILVSPGFQFWMVLFLWAYGAGCKEHMAWSALLVLLYMVFVSFSISYFSKLDAAIPMFSALPLLWVLPVCSYSHEAHRVYPYSYDPPVEATRMRKVPDKKAKELFPSMPDDFD